LGGQHLIVRQVRGDIPFEDDRGRRQTSARGLAGIEPAQVCLSLLFGEPHNLKQAVALDASAHVVVNGLTRTVEQPRGRVVLGHDQVGIRFTALERDAHGHLPQRRAGDAVRPAERLRAQNDVHAKRAALTDDAVEQERCLLREFVIFDEELLELIHHQQQTRQRGIAGLECFAKPRDILHPCFAE
jgi:hypothetical protein